MALVAHSLELPDELWTRLERLQHRAGLATVDEAVGKAIEAGYAVLDCDGGPRPPPSPRARPLSRSAAARVLAEAGLDALGIPEQPRGNGQ